MKKLSTYIILLCCFMLIPVFAQEEAMVLPAGPGEALALVSDRSIYGAGEDVHYFASYTVPASLKGSPWSTVLYVELINWDGTKQAASKVLIRNGAAEGSLEIPDNMSSGVYYLRAYTKWMRNYSPDTYAYLPLRILNPRSQEVLAGSAEGNGKRLSIEHLSENQTEGIRISGMKDQFRTGEKVELGIQISRDLLPGRYSVGISKTPAQSSLDYSIGNKAEAHEPGKIEYLPEMNGLTLSGRIIDSDTGEPVEGASLHLSSYANPFLYAEVISAGDGSFLFTLPHFTGNPELHIANGSDSLLNHKVLLASEFCNKPLNLPYTPLRIDSAEQDIVREILVNTQLKERYTDESDLPGQNDGLDIPFYGKGASVTYVNDFIELSDLGEFIYEIIPQVSINSSSSGSFLSVQGPSCMDIYPPLVLMDNVPVNNNEEFLNIPSNRIERIEVLNQAYMVGNKRYSGIFSVYSSKRDMAGITQEGERYFFNLRFLDDKHPDHMHGAGPGESSLPDIRNLLYWEPEIEITDEGTGKVSFRTPDIPGEYVLTLRGAGPGKSLYKKALISVK